MTRILSLAALALAIPVLAAAQGAPQYSAEQILEHFQPGDAAGTGTVGLPKRNTRAVCIGTASECAQHEAEVAAGPQDAGGFDLLITFEFGSDRLSEQARVNLTEFARAMRDPALASAGFNVDGHTDAVGSDAFNQALSERRAASVVDYLEGLGIDRSRLTAQGHGESRLRDAAHPEAGINRRVEATLRAR